MMGSDIHSIPLTKLTNGKLPRIAVVGGGFSGAAFALHLVRRATRPILISIIEPRAALGYGLAYGTRDPAHRVNVPARIMSLFPDAPQHFEDWLRKSGALDSDPGMIAPQGLFPHRATF